MTFGEPPRTCRTTSATWSTLSTGQPEVMRQSIAVSICCLNLPMSTKERRATTLRPPIHCLTPAISFPSVVSPDSPLAQDPKGLSRSPDWRLRKNLFLPKSSSLIAQRTTWASIGNGTSIAGQSLSQMKMRKLGNLSIRAKSRKTTKLRPPRK